MKPVCFTVLFRVGILALLTQSVAAQTPASVTLSDVYSLVASTTTDNKTGMNGFDQHRSIAMNANLGSPWAGTMYISRRAQPTPSATAIVFYWKPTATNPSAAPGSGTLKPVGPDLTHPDGIFDNAVIKTAGFDPAAGNSFWGIGVGEDDYVYLTGLTAGKVVRCHPDGTNPVLVVASGFPRVRTIYVTGKGIDTRIWGIKDNVYPPATTTVERWKPTAVDGFGGPVSFIQEILFAPAETVNQMHQLVVDSAQTAVFFGQYLSGQPYTQVPPMKRSLTGVEDTLFTSGALSSGIIRASATGIDSEDRVVYFGMSQPNLDWGIAAVDPVTGANLTTNTSSSGGFYFLSPSGVVSSSLDYDNFVYMSRYSDRHFFYAYNRAYVSPLNDGSTVIGVFGTDVPAPAPKGVTVSNSAVAGTLVIKWTLKDPESIGVDIYRSGISGTLGTKINASPLTGGSYDDTGLTEGATFYYTVRTVCRDPFTNTNYTSVNTDQHWGIVRVPGVPDPPANPSAADKGDGSGVLIAWTNPPADVDSIRVYRSEAGGILGSLVKSVSPVTPGANGSWLDDTVAMGSAYWYTVRAANGAGQESPNTNQLSVTATDTVAPAFSGVTATKDLGYPGLRLTWTSAVDNTYPITYNIYVAPAGGSFDFLHPTASTTTTAGVYDLGNMTLRQTYYIVIRACDGAGNEEKNTVTVFGTPTRVIVDSDQNGGINVDKVDPQPDPAYPALIPAPINIPKSQAPDLVPTGYLGKIFYYQTNDNPGKVKYTMPIPQAGTYEIATTWSPWSAIYSLNYWYHITYPDGSTEDVQLDQWGGGGNVWRLLSTRQLTPGTLTIVGDASQITTGESQYWNVSGAVRAYLPPPSPVSIYRATAPPTITSFVPSEWANVPPLSLNLTPQIVTGAVNWTGPADYSSQVYAMWDDTNLYLAVKASDDVVSLSDGTDYLIWLRDALDLFIGLTNPQEPRTLYDAADFEVVLSATDIGGTLGGYWYCSQNPTLTGATSNVTLQRTTGGYTLIARIPWADLAPGMTPTAGQVIGFNLHGIDNDQPAAAQDTVFSLSEKSGSSINPANWLQAVMLGTPPPVLGDLNSDSLVTGADAVIALRIAGGLEALGARLNQGDVAGGDSVVNILDAARILRKVNGLDTF